MKNLSLYIYESSEEKSMFMGATSHRTADDFSFNEGENVLIIKYDTHRYEAQLRGVHKIAKVNKKSVSIDDEWTDGKTLKLKFNNKGIAITKSKNKYLGNSTQWWVLYNKELIDEEDITGLLEKGTNLWGFKFTGYEDYIKEKHKDLKKYIKDVKS